MAKRLSATSRRKNYSDEEESTSKRSKRASSTEGIKPSRRSRRSTEEEEQPRKRSSRRTEKEEVKSSRRSNRKSGDESDSRKGSSRRSEGKDAKSASRSRRKSEEGVESRKRSSRRGSSVENAGEEASASSRSSRSSRSSVRASRRGRASDSTRTSARGDSEERRALAAAKAKKDRRKIIFGCVFIGALVIGGMFAAGPVKKMMQLSALASTDAESRKGAINGLAAWGEPICSTLVDIIKGLPKEDGWKDASRYDAARCLVRVNSHLAAKELAALGVIGGDEPNADQGKIRLWVMKAVNTYKLNRKPYLFKYAEKYDSRIFLYHVGVKDVESRIYAARSLRFYKGAPITEALLKLLVDPENEVRLEATKSLITLRDMSCLPKLLEILKSEVDYQREAALSVIQACKSKEAVVELGEYMSRASEEMQLKILGVYRKYGMVYEMNKYVKKAINQSPLAVKADALALAGELGLRECHDEVIKAITDIAPEMRAAAARAVVGFRNNLDMRKKIYPLLNDKERIVRRAALFTIKTDLDRGATGEIIKLMDHGDLPSRADGVEVLEALFAETSKNSVYSHKDVDSPGRWKSWYNRYREQQQFVEQMQADYEKIGDLMGDQTNESYKKVLKIIESNFKRIQAFQAGKFEGGKFGTGIVKELRIETAAMFKSMLEEMAKNRYWAKKQQTM